MANEIVPSTAATSSISKLTRQLEKIDAIPKSNTVDAMGAVDLLMARYAGQKPANPDLYYKLMVSACTGVDIDILNSIWHPTHGIKGEFLPSVPTVVDFLHERLERRQREYERAQMELKQLTKPEEPKESEEERAAAVAKWEAVRKNMKLNEMQHQGKIKGKTNEGEGRQGVNTAETSPAAPILDAEG